MKKYFILSFLLGALTFILIYGTAVLDVTGDGWVFKSDNDLRQHYLGWMAYRDSDTIFPLGMTDRLSYPTEMSTVYTDSIPLVAFFAKLLSPLLPRPFQYFGWYALLCFALTAAIGCMCLCRLMKNRLHALLLSTLFVLSYPMLQRTFYHTSLASQWIILLGFYLWFSDFAKSPLKLRIFLYALLGVLCVGIHTYFLPMLLAILCFSQLDRLVAERSGSVRIILSEALPPIAMCFFALITLWSFGAFTVKDTGNYWIGDFTMNLNSFINPLEIGSILPPRPLFGDMQFEGAAYLGLGGLIFAGFILLNTLTAVILKKHTERHYGSSSEEPVKSVRTFIFSHPRRFTLLLCALILLAASTLPTVAFDDRLIFRLPLNAAANRLLGIFRSNGRFAWPVMYIIFFTIARLLDSYPFEESLFKGDIPGDNAAARRKAVAFSRRIMPALICMIVIAAQIFDYSGWMAKKHKKYADAQKTYRTVWDEINLPDIYDGFVIFEDDNSFIMGTAYYAMRHNMTVNTFYFARDIDEITEKQSREYKSMVILGKPDPHKIYVLDRSTYDELKDNGLYFYRTRKCAFGVAERIEGMEELTESDLDDISWQ